ncbi:MAG: hypothetical protein HY960_03955 [Ignavibacteriae bacterium]|nr:hypothetical protein [Ignavibacteriota bacterium]
MKNYYYILLFDLVRSRRLENRESATKQLKRAIHKINTTYKKSLFAPMEITRGDEVATVLKHSEHLYDIAGNFINELRPFRCRCVVVRETLTAGLASRRSPEMDGPGFYLADETLQKLKKTKKLFQMRIPSAETYETVLTGLINLLLFRKEQLTNFQLQVLELYKRNATQTEIAKKLKRTPQQVSIALKAVPQDIVLEGEIAVGMLLQQLPKQLKGMK